MILDRTPDESTIYKDPISGASIRQLTNHLAHSYHPYFTNPGWWGGGRHVLFGSDRGNRSNLYSMDLQTFALTQLTDNPPGDRTDFQGIAINPRRDEAYWWRDGVLHAIDLTTARQWVLFECEPGWTAHGSSATADGEYVVASMSRKVDVGPVDLGAGYIGFGAIFEARPFHQIVRVRTAGEHNAAEVLHEENAWIGHVNPSPTQPHLITYCYEGPWTRVGQRIWGFDLNQKRHWKIRPQSPGEAIGHEYWMEDGLTVGYHGKIGEAGVYGFARFDDSQRIELPFPLDSHHFHSNTPELIVADGPARGLSPHVLLCRYRDGRIDGPRVLCRHRSSRHTQHLHVHPRFTPDGNQVLYTADPRGYGQLFVADVPDFESLPRLEDVTKR